MRKIYIYLCVVIIVGFTYNLGYSQGACCFPSGGCASSPQATAAICFNSGGNVWLPGVDCLAGPNPCTIGACCTGGNCLPGLTRGECLASGTNNTFSPTGNCNPTSPNFACGSGRLQIVPTLRAVYSPQASNVQLQWDLETFFNTGTEFNIERSRDGANYKLIGIIDGNAAAPRDYSFIDNYPFQIGYYRITFFSVSGKAYSQTISVVSVDNDKLYLMPNPATTTLRVLLSNMQSYETTLSVHDLSGRQVRSYKLNRGQNEINVSNLPQGTYIMQAKMNGNMYTSRFVKN